MLVVSAFALSACAPFNYVAPDRPLARQTVQPISPAPRIALVLGSGGPRGYAHIGVLKVLEEMGIQPDLVVGTSVGALLGAFWADGNDAATIDVLAASGGPLMLFDISPFADRGWIHGERLQNFVNERMKQPTIESLRKPLVVVATERGSKVPTFFQSGNIGVAVRASSAVPNIISPVGIAGVEYEDGDESLPVAVRAARQAGAQFVIAVDVSARAGSAPEGTADKWLQSDAKRRTRIDPEVANADFVIHPDLGYLAAPSREYFVRVQALGEAYARTIMPALKTKLTEAKLLTATP